MIKSAIVLGLLNSANIVNLAAQKRYRHAQSPRPSLYVFILTELNAVEGAVWFQDYVVYRNFIFR